MEITLYYRVYNAIVNGHSQFFNFTLRMYITEFINSTHFNNCK